jgi:hypothetical protein
MVSVCPQQHADSEALTSRLLALRWQISRLRKETGHSVPLVLNGQVGSAMTNDMLWQAAIPGKGEVWRESSAPGSIAAWVTTGGACDAATGADEQPDELVPSARQSRVYG